MQPTIGTLIEWTGLERRTRYFGVVVNIGLKHFRVHWIESGRVLQYDNRDYDISPLEVVCK